MAKPKSINFTVLQPLSTRGSVPVLSSPVIIKFFAFRSRWTCAGRSSESRLRSRQSHVRDSKGQTLSTASHGSAVSVESPKEPPPPNRVEQAPFLLSAVCALSATSPTENSASYHKLEPPPLNVYDHLWPATIRKLSCKASLAVTSATGAASTASAAQQLQIGPCSTHLITCLLALHGNRYKMFYKEGPGNG